MSVAAPSIIQMKIVRMTEAGQERLDDEVACEEPLEIRLLQEIGGEESTYSVAVTMRTPGADFELACGFLFSEGIVNSLEDVLDVNYCTGEDEKQNFNIVSVRLRSGLQPDLGRLKRNIYMNSSCGVCGKASIEAIQATCRREPVGTERIDADIIYGFPDRLNHAQSLFARTGGMHAAALYDLQAGLIDTREDVGRHNAVDKLIGNLMLKNRLPADNKVLMLSGRAAFELVQKSILAGIPFITAIGAPSSLAVELAREYGLTLIGFLRGRRFNVYSGEHRLG